MLFRSMPVRAAYLIDTGPAVYTSGGLALSSQQKLAGWFNLTKNSTLKSIEGYIGGFGGNANISIYSNIFDPNTLVFSSPFSTKASYFNGGDTWQGAYNLNWNLNPGSYWVAFSSDGFDWMSFTGIPNPLSGYASASNYTSWQWQMSGNSFGVRIAGSQGSDTTGGVPEPATWAMMIVGLGAVGATMRGKARRRVRAQTA